MIFSQMLDIIAFNDLASVLCARKFSFAPTGVDPKLPPFHFYLLLLYYLFIIIGLSASAERPMESRLSVRASVTPYLEIRASDFDDFLHKATS